MVKRNPSRGESSELDITGIELTGRRTGRGDGVRSMKEKGETDLYSKGTKYQ